MSKRVLDIIIPHYQESWDICRPMFDMLNAQKMVDFNEFKVFLIHDGPVIDFSPAGYFENCAFQIEVVALKHKGVSACRNYGLHHSSAEWITFCDCDDCFSSIFSLMMILYTLKSEGAKQFDLMWNEFYMTPMKENDQTLAKNPGFNNVFIHNKYYRRTFLLKHKMEFPEHLYMSEDSAFNNVLYMEIDHKRIGTINSDFPLYSWCRRPGSITMDFSRWLSNTEGHFYRNVYVLNEYRKRKYEFTNLMVARTITDVYSMLCKPGIEGDVKPFIKKVRAFYKRKKKEYLSVPEDKLKQALDASDKDMGHSKEVLESRLTLNDWIKEYLDPAT